MSVYIVRFYYNFLSNLVNLNVDLDALATKAVATQLFTIKRLWLKAVSAALQMSVGSVSTR